MFGGGGIYLLQPQSESQTEPPHANAETLDAAKAKEAQLLAESETAACQPHVSVACLKLRIDPETGKRLREAVWAEAFLEVLMERRK